VDFRDVDGVVLGFREPDAGFAAGGVFASDDLPVRIASTRSEIFLTFSDTADATSGAFSLTNSVAAETCS
jgi:hypothetical protein